MRDGAIFLEDRIYNSRQITDLYLLALSVDREGRLVTFDEKITLSPVRGAQAKNLCLIH
jgi:hypothetical protein